ncbi:MAG: Uma2 family endonuclease [Pseudonocardia sp.]|nr:Uma2 family endonuclease [Pseudonocardia sp.]
MRVLMVDAPQAMLDERRRLDQDKRDEMWDGVLHMVPPAGGPHQGLGYGFLRVAGPLAEQRGLVPRYETGLFRSDSDYRVPDLSFCRPEHLSERGLEGAELVVEIRSPRDETYEKLDFYARVGVLELLVLHPRPRRVELFRNVAGRMLPVQSDGKVHSEVLGLTLHVEDDELVLAWDGGTARI